MLRFRVNLFFAFAFVAIMTAADPLPPAVVNVLQRYRTLEKTDPAAAEKVLADYLAKNRHPAVLFEMAVLRARQKRLAAAVKLFREVVGRDPGYPNAKANLGQLLVQTGAYDEAVEVLSDLARREELNAHRALLLGQCYLALDKPVAAEQSLRVALVGFPNDEQVKLSLAMALYRQKRYAACEAAAREVLARNPARTEAWGLLANARLLAGRDGAAIDALEAVTRLNPQCQAQYFWTLGDLYLRQGLTAPALAAYQKAAKRSKPDPERSLRVARIRLDEGNIKGAIELAAPLAQSSSSQAHLVLGLAAKLQGRTTDAIKYLRQAAKLDPLNGEALLALGDLALAAGDYAGAVSYYRTARTIPKWELPALEAEAEALLRHEDFKAALDVLKQLRQRRPDSQWERLIREVEQRLE